MLGRSTSNGKTINKLLGFANQQVRHKSINFNYRGKATLRDGISGSTIEVGTPVNDSMSVSVWAKGYSRCLQINRPRESNRITSEVARDLLHQFKVMNTNPIINLISLTGIGNGFLSAGYDFRELQHLMDKGDYETIYSLVRDTHKLAYYAANCETPTMSVVNGLMLGPGSSLGTSANYVIATPGSIFSAADASYGYFPDCGVTFLLSRVNQKYEGLGTFLGLTGGQVRSSDLVNIGIATSFGMESIAQYMAERLLQVQTGATQDDIHNCIVESTETNVPALSFAFELYKIREHFSNKKSVDEIIQSLKNTITDPTKTKPEKEWAANILDNLNQMSPLSLKITFRAIQECDQGLSLDETYQRDYRIASRLIKSKDFKQGINCVLNGVEPVWEHESVEQVSDSVVNSFFGPLSFEMDKDCDLQVPEEVFLEDQILYQIKKNKSVQVTKQ